ncbi:phosphate ABC transporter permease subunit PstC [Aquabacterium sp. A7-Y]|uniref:phosphate ABC transporter permease subunit PstC n=1 Tax=Aquabacterium sp. A7-Y TaxID=1349605 RepID=UPI00223D97D0|nr:phosphate ABC transporter permease subunit PstC [Aquabacterium sp. A7-Y]MCW7540991.1 phosphate ABC transporter permease subunit PstC [Aquabacterium sp. A7-Y]
MISSKTSTLYLSPPRSDLWLVVGLRVLAAFAVALLTIIIWCLLSDAWNVFAEVGVARLAMDDDWHPTENRFGLAPMAIASVASAVGSVVVAAPMGVGAAIWCRFHSGPRVSRAFRQMLALFAGVPSVIFGFWGLTTLVPLIARTHPPGASLLAGSLVLAMMILPTIALTSHSALEAVPSSYLAAGHALGLRHGTIVVRVALVAARHGILVGVILSLGRALGETMAMLMVSGNVVQVPSSVYDSVRSLASNIALEMAYAAGIHRSALYACGLALIAVVALTTVLSDRILHAR